MEQLIRLAGLLQLLIASANLVAARMFRYREGLASAPRTVRDVFVSQNVFLVLFLVGASLGCFFFAAELSGETAFGRAASGFLSVFWGLRLAFQFLFYDAEKRREHRLFDVLFVLAFLYLTVVFGIAAAGTK